MATPAFSLTPAPTTGQGAFGAVPGNVTNPISNAPALNDAAGGDILSKLGGTLSPGTMNALQNAQATFGQTSGMPGAGLSWNSLYGNIAGASENQQQQGLTDYNAITGPAFQTGLAEQNAVNAAAPDPTQAASYAEQLFNKYLASMGGGHGGVSGLPQNLLQPGGFGGGSVRSSVAPSVNPSSGGLDFSNLFGTDPSSGATASPYGGGAVDYSSVFNPTDTFGADPSYDPFASLGGFDMSNTFGQDSSYDPFASLDYGG